jgi:hypothetical protein
MVRHPRHCIVNKLSIAAGLMLLAGILIVVGFLTGSYSKPITISQGIIIIVSTILIVTSCICVCWSYINTHIEWYCSCMEEPHLTLLDFITDEDNNNNTDDYKEHV